MRILITGVCGFVGHALACELKKSLSQVELFGLDNFIPVSYTHLTLPTILRV